MASPTQSAQLAIVNQAYQIAYGMTPQSSSIQNYWLQQLTQTPMDAATFAATIRKSQAVYLAGSQIQIASQLPNGSGGWTAPQVHYAAVVVLPPANGTGPGTVLLPNGKTLTTHTFVLPSGGTMSDYQSRMSFATSYTCPLTLDVSQSSTGGIQEAICYAAAYGWDLFVYGAGVFSSNPKGTYALSTPLFFPSLELRTIRFMNVDLEFGPQITDSAVLFDSTMMVDVELTGTINAPHATSGVTFSPYWPFALDGCPNPAVGLPNGAGAGGGGARFEFETINAKQYGINFVPLAPGSLDSGGAFYAGNGTAPGYGNESNCLYCFLESSGEVAQSHLNDTSVSLDVLNPTGVVIVPPTQTNPQATAILPDGEILNTSQTTTMGLQEALNFATASNKDIAVYGWGVQNLNTLCHGSAGPTTPQFGFYGNVGSPAIVPPAFSTRPGGSTLRLYSVTTGNNNGYYLQVSAADHFELELVGQTSSPSTVFYLQSTDGPIQNSLFKIGSAVSSGPPYVAQANSLGTNAVDFDLESDGYPIQNNVFLLRELGYIEYGFVAYSNQGQAITNNYFRASDIHDFSMGGAWFRGTAITNNRFDLFVQADIAASFSIDMGGSGNYVYEATSGLNLTLTDGAPNINTLMNESADTATQFITNRTPYIFENFPAPYGF